MALLLQAGGITREDSAAARASLGAQQSNRVDPPPVARALAANEEPAKKTGAEEQVARGLGHGRDQEVAGEADRIVRHQLDVGAEVESAGEAGGDAAEIVDLVVEQGIELSERRHLRGGDAKAAD